VTGGNGAAAPRRPRYPGDGVPGRRLFIAVPFPDDAVEPVVALVDEVRALGVPGGGRDVRWVRLDGLHLTLRFIGPTLPDRVAPAEEAVRAAARSIEPFEVGISGAGAFPAPQRPRALWLGVDEGVAGMEAAARSVDAALVERGWATDDRPFRPHLTLARSDGVPAGAAIATRLMERAPALHVRFHVDRVGLYESLTGGGPARYEPLAVILFGS
jgi:RNA 2',3'-cyclic 3'-phosphodiesterase